MASFHKAVAMGVFGKEIYFCKLKKIAHDALGKCDVCTTEVKPELPLPNNTIVTI